MMRKEYIFRYMLAIFAFMVSLPMCAYDIAVKNADGVTIYYNWNNGRTELAVCYGYFENGDYTGDIVIPESVEYDGKTYSVTDIDSQAFQRCSGLTSVIIPNSVTHIWTDAFRYCDKLTSITLPSTLRWVSDLAFNGCVSLNAVHISDLEAFFKISFEFDSYSSYPISTNPLCYAGHLFLNGEEIKDLEIPNDITEIKDNACVRWYALNSLKIPNSVTSIGKFAFYGCSGLTSIIVENSNPVYDSRNDCNAIIETSSNTLLVGCNKTNIPNSVTSIEHAAFYDCSGLTSVTISNSVTSIGSYAFNGCSGLTSVTIPNSVTSIEGFTFRGCSGLTSLSIPNSVTSIGSSAFNGCSGLTSVTIPSSVTSIGYYAFYGCSGLTSIISDIEKPFELREDVFDSDIYANATLTVPAGTKSLYQNTTGWNKFKNIVEESPDDVSFILNGVTYQGTKSAKTVMVTSVDKSQTSLEIPASVNYDGTDYQVTGIDNDAFKGSNMAALIWNVETALPNDIFSNASIGSNFLLYVKSASYAPSSVKNVVANGTAQTVVLADDGGQFYCPKAFTARSISYTHNYSMETGGNGKGWETIALPFDVQRIVHSTCGEIVPFAGYGSGSNQKPFWLANMSASGFKRASSIQAYEPYIIAMPNNSKYNNDYNLAGDVTFSADNVQVAKTPTFSGLFLPAFGTVAQSSTVYALNVNNRYVKYSGSYDAGSRFISNLRDVRPFEAYMTGSSSSRGIIEINFDDGTTNMDDILFSANDGQVITIHALSGQQVARTTQRDFDQIWNGLPKGVYIVNGKKMIK